MANALVSSIVTFFKEYKNIILFAIIILISFLIKSIFHKNDDLPKRIIKIVPIVIFIFFYFKRTLQYKKIFLFFDEKIVFLITILMFVSNVIINRDISLNNISHPVGFIITYFGLSSFFIIDRIDIRKIRIILFIYLFFTFLHLIPMLFKISEIISLLLKAKAHAGFYGNISRLCIGLLSADHSSNAFGLRMMVALMSAISLYLIIPDESKKNRIINIFLIIVIIFLAFFLLVSFSRASIFGFLVYLIIILILVSSKYKDLIKLKWKVILMLSIFILSIYKLNYFDLLFIKFRTGTGYRMDFWMIALQSWFKEFPNLHFFMGHGHSAVIKINHPKWNPVWNIHNLYLQILFEYGWLTLISFLYLIFHTIKDFFANKTCLIFAAVVIGFMVHGLFEVKIFNESIRLPSLFLYTMLIIPGRVSFMKVK